MSKITPYEIIVCKSYSTEDGFRYYDFHIITIAANNNEKAILQAQNILQIANQISCGYDTAFVERHSARPRSIAKLTLKDLEFKVEYKR